MSISTKTAGNKLNCEYDSGAEKQNVTIVIDSDVASEFSVEEKEQGGEYKETHHYTFSSPDKRQYSYSNVKQFIRISSTQPGNISCEVRSSEVSG